MTTTDTTYGGARFGASPSQETLILSRTNTTSEGDYHG